MKKLLLIAVLALGVVACEKNDLGMDMNGSSINPIEPSVAIDVMDNIDLDGMVSRMLDFNSNNKGTPNTAKEATAGTSYISVYTGIINGDLFEIAFPDGVTHCAPIDSGLTHLTLFYASNGNSELYLGEISNNILLATITEIPYQLYEDDLVDYGIKIDGSSKSISFASVTNSVYTF